MHLYAINIGTNEFSVSDFFFLNENSFFSVLGTPFYVMEYVRGRIFKNATLPGLSAHERQVRISKYAISYFPQFGRKYNTLWYISAARKI